MMKRKLLVAAALAALAALGACGGGSSDGATVANVSGSASGAVSGSTSGSTAGGSVSGSGSISVSGSTSSGSISLSGSTFTSGDSVAPTPPVPTFVPGSEAAKLDDAAVSQRKEVEALVEDGPCETDNQCGLLSLNEYASACAFPFNVPYLLSSGKADAAVAAAQVFNDLSRQAAAAQPWYGTTMCMLMVQPVRPSCDAQKKKCVVGDASQLILAPSPVVLELTPAN